MLRSAFQNIRDGLSEIQRSEFNWPADKVIDTFERYDFLLSLDSTAPSADAKIQGFIGFQRLAGDVEIIVLGTIPELRRQKIMLQLINHLVQKICSTNSKIFLEVHDRNQAALKFYLSIGFDIDGYRKNYYSDGACAVNMSYVRKG